MQSFDGSADEVDSGKVFWGMRVVETWRGEGRILRGDWPEGFLAAGGWLADEG